MTADDDDQRRAEALDGDVLGEQPDQAEMPGEDYPPDEPMGVEDPTMLEGSTESDDAMVVREWRTSPDETPEPRAAGEDRTGATADGDGGEGAP